MKDYLTLSDDLAFYTIEGEGEHIGKPSVFLRLSNCNLTCKGFATEDSPHGCDSYISWSKKNKYTFKELNDFFARNLFDGYLRRGAILKITGGEPLLQRVALKAWLITFEERFGFMPWIDFETNGTILVDDEYWGEDNEKVSFTVSPKLSNNGDPEKVRYKPKAIKWLSDNGACFKFVVSEQEQVKEIYDMFIEKGLVAKSRVWLMPCCGSREEHTQKSAMVAELCKWNNFNFSPRLQLVIWDMALKV